MSTRNRLGMALVHVAVFIHGSIRHTQYIMRCTDICLGVLPRYAISVSCLFMLVNPFNLCG